MDHRKFQQLLGVVDELSAGQAEKLDKALAGRGDGDEVQRLIEQAFLDDLKCPHCGHTELYRWGRSHGLQRWRCRSCKKTFNALTGTPLARLQHKEQWLNFARTLTQSLPVRAAAKTCGIAKNTSLNWRHRFFEAAKDAKDQKLEGVVEVDEIFFFGELQRQPHASPPGEKTRRQSQKARPVG